MFLLIGKYECRAQNKLGQGQGIIEVVRQYEPNCIVGICEGFTAASSKSDISLICLTLMAMVSSWTTF